MNRKTVTLVDYYGSCDGQGKPIGHSSKVLMEYSELIKNNYRLEAILPPSVSAVIDKSLFDKITKLPYQIVEEGNRSLIKRIIDKGKLFRNIYLANRYSTGNINWYYKADFFLFLYYFFHRKPKEKKMICLLYQQRFAQGILGNILNLIFESGLQKFDAVIYTQKDMKISHPICFYMPDYYYESKYERYARLPKENKVVCLGTMNPYKELEELVRVFNENGIMLEIVGKFFSRNRFLCLKSIARENITIENVILSESEYYQKLAGAKYSILPYDVNQYESRTSGVLMESVFVGSVPIAPNSLLHVNGICGIGYDRLEELKEGIWQEKYEKVTRILNQQREIYPDKVSVSKGLNAFLLKQCADII